MTRFWRWLCLTAAGLAAALGLWGLLVRRRDARDASARDRALSDAAATEDARVRAAEVKHDAAVARVDARLEEDLHRDTVDVGHELALEEWRRQHLNGGKS